MFPKFTAGAGGLACAFDDKGECVDQFGIWSSEDFSFLSVSVSLKPLKSAGVSALVRAQPLAQVVVFVPQAVQLLSQNLQ